MAGVTRTFESKSKICSSGNKRNSNHMISQILVLTDFSKTAENALVYALKLSEKAKAKVHVLHVDQLAVMDIPYPAGNYTELLKVHKKQAENNLTKLKQRMRLKSPVKFETAFSSGFLLEETEAYVRLHKVDLLVMGTSGKSRLEEILIGSNTSAAVRRIETPILVVPVQAKYKHLRKILYASDYTETDFPGIARLFYFAELFDAELTVLHVRSELDKYIKKSSAFFRRGKEAFSYKKLKTARISNQNIMEGINQYAESTKADMLILSKHHRKFFERIFHRSLSKRMVFHAKVPLLILNAENS